MESITKNRQRPATMRAMIARAYGRARVPAGEDFAVELDHGWFNAVYRITLGDGAQVVLKVAPPAGVEVMTYERDMMRNELAAVALIEQHTSVPVPRVDFADTTREVCDADYFFMPYVDADNLSVISPTLGDAERAAYHRAMGRADREFNSITGPHFGPLAGPGDDSWRRVFTGMVEAVLRDGEHREVDLGWNYALLRNLVREHGEALDEVAEPRFVEWDLWDGNVMVRDGGIVSIIDHERAFYGDPLAEAGFTGTQLPGFGDPTAFMEGYGHPPLTGSQTVRRRLYCLHLILVMIIETVYRGHGDDRQYTWTRGQLDALMALFGHRR